MSDKMMTNGNIADIRLETEEEINIFSNDTSFETINEFFELGSDEKEIGSIATDKFHEEKEKKESEDDVLPDFYVQYYRSIPILTKEEEYDLGVKLKEGTEEERKEARDKLVEHNLRYVLKLSKRYVGHGISIDDIIQYGAMGLIKATEKFDYELGYRFTTYATYWIRQSIVRGIQTYGRAIYLPAYIYCDLAKIKKADTEIAGKYKNEAEHVRKLSSLTGFDCEKVLYIREITSSLTSLDLPVGTEDDHDSTLMDYIKSEEISVESSIEREMLKCAISQVAKERLTEQEQDIIKKRFGLDGEEPQTLSQIGSKKKLSRERIRQVEARALAKLRRTSFAAKYRGYLT